MIPDALQTAWRWQATACETMGAPFSAAVLRACVDAPAPSAALAPILGPYAVDSPASAIRDALPLRILGALHYLVLTGRDRDLARVYAALDASTLDPVLADAIGAHSEVLAAFMRSPPQTNEVSRSFCLVGGFLSVAQRFGLPLRCLELGASAGLNSNWDRFAYVFGGDRSWGAPDASLTLSGDWTGPAPPIPQTLTVMERRACDLSPIDVGAADGAARLQAYVWADQAQRLERVRTAIEIARAHPVTVETANAARWIETVGAPRPGAATVVFHSIFLQYPPEEDRNAIVAAVLRHGQAASDAAPFAWLRMEPKGDTSPEIEVRLTTWPGGEDRRLAEVHPHGAAVRWLG